MKKGVLAGIVFLTLLHVPAPAQDAAQIFLPVDERLATLSNEIERLLRLGETASLRKQLREFLTLITSQSEDNGAGRPVRRSRLYTSSPWRFLGEIWNRLPPSVQTECREALNPLVQNSTPASPLSTRKQAQAETIFFSIPDAELRNAFGPALAHDYFEKGQLARAERCYELFHATRQTDDADPLLRGKTAAALLRQSLSAPLPPTGSPESDPALNDFKQQLRAVLNRSFSYPERAGPWTSSWNRAAPGSLPETHRFTQIPQLVADRGGGTADRFAHFPVIAGSRCFVFNGATIVAIDLETSKKVWEATLDDKSMHLRGSVLAPAANRSFVFAAAGDTLGCFRASDGTPCWKQHIRPTQSGGVTWQRIRLTTPPAFSQTPPLLADGTLFIGSVYSGINKITAYLSAFCPENGNLLWTINAGSAETTDYLGLRSLPQPLSFHAGTIYFCPNIGFIAAVQAASGAILFEHIYPRMHLSAEQHKLKEQSHWELNPSVHHEDLIITAPRDANELLGFNRFSGSLVFRVPKENGSYFLGPDKGKLFVVGRTLRAIQLAGPDQGKTLFRRKLPSKPHGRGIVVNNSLALPFKNTLLFFSTDTGAVLSTHLWELADGGGNLLATRWGLLVSNKQEIDLYRDLQEELLKVQLSLPTLHENLRHLVKARYALKQKLFADACASLDRYVQNTTKYIAPDEKRERLERIHVVKLLHSWLELAIPLERKLAFCDYIAELSVDNTKTVSALILKGDLYGGRKEYGKAAQSFYAALANSENALIPVSSGLSVRSVPYIIAKLKETLDFVPDKDNLLAPFREQSAGELEHARTLQTVSAYNSLIRKYPFTPASQQAVLECAQIYLANQNSIAAIQLLTDHYNQFPDAPYTSKLLLLLSKIYEASDLKAQAAELYTILRSRFGDTMVTHEQRKEKMSAWAGRKLADLATRADDIPAHSLRLPLQLSWLTRSNLLDRKESIRFIRPAGTAPQPFLFTRGEHILNIYGKQTGLLQQVLPLTGPVADIGMLNSGEDSVIVVSGRERITGYPLHNTRPVFSITVAEKDAPQAYIQDIQFSGETLLCLADATLSRFDAAGRTLWETELPSRGHAPIIDLPGATAVFSAYGGSLYFVDKHTGGLADTLALDLPQKRLSLPPLHTGRASACAVYGDTLCCIDLQKRKSAWHKRLETVRPSRIRHFETHPDRIYLWGRSTGGDCRLLALDLADGQVLWQTDFARELFISDMAANGRELVLLCGHTVQKMVTLVPDIDGLTEKWRKELYKTYEKPAPLFVSSGTVFHGNYETNRIAAVSTRTGNLLEPGIQQVKSFLAKRKLIDYILIDDSFYLLTENGIGCFRFFDKYARSKEREHYIMKAFASSPPHPEDHFELGRFLLSHGRAAGALHFLDDVLWEKWFEPGKPAQLWQMLEAAQEETNRQRNFVITCLPAPPEITIDGLLEERWPLQTAVSLNRPRHVATLQRQDNLIHHWKGPADLSATLFTAWDEEAFYFALELQDNVLVPHQNNSEAWIGDCLLVAVDKQGDGGFYPQPDDDIFTVYLSINRQPNNQPGRKPPGRFTFKVDKSRAGIVFEFKLPWSYFHGDGNAAEASPVSLFGINIMYIDDDTGHGAHQTLSPNAAFPLSTQPKRLWHSFVPDFSPKIILKQTAGHDR